MKFSIVAIVAFAVAAFGSPLEESAKAPERQCRVERGRECRDNDFHIRCERVGDDRITCCRDRC